MMAHTMKYGRGGNYVIGRCYYCRGPVRASEHPTKVWDSATGTERLCHAGSCRDHVQVLLTAGDARDERTGVIDRTGRRV